MATEYRFEPTPSSAEGVPGDVPRLPRRVCIAWPDRQAYSETFIRAHVERLPAEVVTLSGDVMPVFADDGTPLLPPAQRWLNRRVADLRGVPVERVHLLAARAYPPKLRERAVAAYLRKRNVGVVLAEFGPTGCALLGACARANVPLVVHFHGQDAYATRILEADDGRGYSKLFAHAAAIIAVSRDMERQLLSLGAPRMKLHYNPYGVDMDRFGQANPAAAPPRFIAVGRFVDKKAPHLTLLAFRSVADRFADASLVMVGDGPLLEACKQMAGALGLEGVVHFPGVRSHQEVAEVLRRGRAFVQHSLRPGDGDSEGTPVAVLEAAASGLPVIATRHGGIPDVVVDGDTGILVHERDVRSMADAMLALAGDPERAARLGAAGRRRIHEHFSMDRSIAGLAGILASAAERASAASATDTDIGPGPAGPGPDVGA